MTNQVYRIITDQIIEKLEGGIISWRMPWYAGKAPSNFISRKPYRGINAILLGMQTYKCRYWMTWNQIKAMGGKVAKGEQASNVIFWKRLEIEEEEEDRRGDVTLKSKRIPFVRFYRVWNLEQTEGIEIPEEEEPGEGNEPVQACEDIAARMPNRPNIVHQERRAYYSPSLDYVNLPRFKSFKSPESYYSTLFHELVHSTGHESRLDRPGSKDRDSYSKEELIAEIGAAFLCAETGIQNRTLENSAAYIQGWLKVLKEDKKILLKAASAAQGAVDHIVDRRSFAEKQEQEKKACPTMQHQAH